MDPSLRVSLGVSSENSNLMSVDQPEIVHGCRWAWCRLIFQDGDALLNHIIHEHVRKSIPVRRRDIPFLRRTEEGLGESLSLSDVMRDPSSSLNTVDKSLNDGMSSKQPPSSSSLPSPPASSPRLPQKCTDDEEPQPAQQSPTRNADENPTFASLSSPAGSPDSLQIPVSPSFSSLVRRQLYKRKRSPQVSEANQSKRPRQLFPVHRTVSPASTRSQRSVEDHLTQTSSYSDKNVDCGIEDGHSSSGSVDARGEVDPDENQVGRCSREDPASVPETSNTPSALNGSESDEYRGELKWDLSSRPATQLTENQEEDGAVQHLETLSQPPSQLQLSSFPFHIQHPKPSSSHLPPIQRDPDNSSLALPPSSPVLLSSPPDFAISTPQRQNWYQPSALRGKASGSGRSTLPNTESTPKPSGRHEVSTLEEGGPHFQVPSSQPRAESPTAMTPRTVEMRMTPQRRQQPTPLPTSIRPVVTPLSKSTRFRSGTLRIAHPLSTPVPRFQQQASPIKTVHPVADALSNINTNKVTESETHAVPLVQGVFAVQESLSGYSQSQSQSDHSMQFSQELSSYPQLQTQAPYQSQSSYSQLD